MIISQIYFHTPIFFSEGDEYKIWALNLCGVCVRTCIGGKYSAHSVLLYSTLGTSEVTVDLYNE